MAIAKIQDAGNNGISLSSINVTIAATGDGNLLVATIGTLTASVSSISGGGSWVSANSVSQGTVRAEVWYALNSTPLTTTVTVTLSGADAVAVDVSEWSGIALTSALEESRTKTGAAANPTLGGIMTGASSPVALFIGCANYVPTTSTVSSQTADWIALTNENASTSLALVSSYILRTKDTSYNNTWTLTPAVATAYAAVGAVFIAKGTIVTKLYLHDAASLLPSGQLPGAGTTSASTPTLTATGATTNRSMDTAIGPVQTSQGQATNANVNPQSIWFRRYVLGSPLAAQTHSLSGAVHLGASQSNANSNMAWTVALVFWRPSTAAVVGRPYDLNAGSSAPGTTETAQSINPAGSQVTCADGDLLIVEVWRQSVAQAMSTSYTNTVFYDGTVEDSTTTNAAYVTFTTGLLLQEPGPTPDSRFLRQSVKRSSVF